MALEVVGRDEELASVREALAQVEKGPTAAIVAGEPGIGKTTLWLAGIAAAENEGFHVLVSRPVEAETQLSYAGLADLLASVPDAVLEELPAPQGRALEVALHRAAAEGEPPDQAAIAFGFLGVLRALGRDGATLVAVDDLQWLDAASAFALRFAARRLRDEAIGLLLAVRTEVEAEVGGWLPERTRRIEVGPLSLGALHHLVQTRLDVALPRPVLQRLHEASAGNPFFALELARALHESKSQVEPGRPLPISGELRQLVEDRLTGLPPECETALLFVAAASQPTVELLEDAVGAAVRALEPALEAELIELEGERIRLAHPLLASAVYAKAGPNRRRGVHLRLAEVVVDREERAHHLALGTEHADADVAAALDDAARSALGRGAPQSAADLSEQALRLTPAEDTEAAHRRRLEAGAAHFEAGDTRRAHELFAQATDRAPGGAMRAEALNRLARLQVFEGGRREAAALFEQALAEGGDDLELRSEAEEGLAVSYYMLRENLVAAAVHAHSAVEAARRLGRPSALAEALSGQGLVEGLLGRTTAQAAFAEAIKLEHATESLRILRRPSYSHAVYLSWTDDLEAARDQFQELHRRALDRGDESSIPRLLTHLSGVECVLGNFESAGRWAAESYEAAVQSGQRPYEEYTLAARALVDAHLGIEERVRAEVEEALRDLREPVAYGSSTSRWALGLLELSLDRPREAHEVLGPLVEQCEAEGIVEPGALRFLPLEIEALVALGENDRARAELEQLEERALRLGRRSALAAAYRCRGLLGDDAFASFGRALDELEGLPMPFERARTLLAFGSAQRRANQRRAAHQTLNEALEAFEALGAALWADRVRAELRRISGRAPSSGELTASEQRVAELVAAGHTNREVAAALYVTPRTVEGTLSRVYSKLGVRSRTELASRWAARDS
jgi:DNA-binding CsgD family transcriptional regulator